MHRYRECFVASVRTIAKRAGVSITSVSRVLNNHPQVSTRIRQRVLAASNEAGYSPTVGRRSTTNIALVYTGEETLGSAFDAALMSGLARAAHETRFDLMILDLRRAKLSSETYTQMFIRKAIRGALLRTTAAARGVCEAIAAEGFPAVVVADRFDNPQVNYVYCDSRDASREAVDHLIGLGHRRIAIGINVVDDTDHIDRLGGYRESLATHGIQFDPRLVLRVPALRQGGGQMLRRLLTMPERPTAIFLTDPVTAVGALFEARKMGVNIPRDISIVGFDDADIRYSVFPELTSVCQDASVLGFEAFNAVMSLLERDASIAGVAPTPVRKALRTWLEIHESAGPAPAKADGSNAPILTTDGVSE